MSEYDALVDVYGWAKPHSYMFSVGYLFRSFASLVFGDTTF